MTIKPEPLRGKWEIRETSTGRHYYAKKIEQSISPKVVEDIRSAVEWAKEQILGGKELTFSETVRILNEAFEDVMK